MRGLLWVLILFAAASGIALMAHFNEGYVLLVVASYRVEMSLNLVIFSIFGGFVLFYMLLRGAALAVALPERMRKSREQSRREKRTTLLLDALRLYFERRYGAAMNCLNQINEPGNLEGVAALVAARITLCMQEPEKQAAWLDSAVQRDAGLKMAAWMLEAERCIQAKMFAEAIELLKKIQDASEHHDQHLIVLKMELQARQAMRESDEILRVTRALEELDGIDPETARLAKLAAHLDNIEKKADDPDQLTAYYKGIPTHEETQEVIHAYAGQLVRKGNSDMAQRFIEKQLSRHWDQTLVDLYGEIGGGEVDLRHLQMEKWKHEHDDDAHLWHAFAKIYLQQNMPEKAEEALVKALSIKELPEARQMLVKLLMEKEDFQQATQYFLGV